MNTKHAIIIAAIAMLAVLLACSAAGAAPLKEISVLETDVYSSGTTRIKNIKLYQGCVVKPVKTSGVRTRVTLRNGLACTVYTSNLKASSRAWSPLPPAARMKCSPSAPLYARVVSDVSLVRTYPSTELHAIKDHTRIGYAPAGMVFPVIGRQGHWLKVRLGSRLSGWLIDETVEVVAKSAYAEAQLLNTEQGEADGNGAYFFTFTRPVFFRLAEDSSLGKAVLTFYNTKYPGDSRGVLEYAIPLPASYKGVDCSLQGSTAVVQVKRFAVDAAEPLKGLVVVLDPGHGSGYDNPARPDWGAIHYGYYEADLNLGICRKLYEALEEKGANVYLTRVEKQVNDTYIYDRLEKARNVKADIFLSIHHNSGTRSSMAGMEFYWCTPGSRALAGEIFDSCVRSGLPYNDKGIYYGSFAVVRTQEFPSVLLEMGFMSNPGELGKLVSEGYQDTLVSAIVEGVEQFARKKAESQDRPNF